MNTEQQDIQRARNGDTMAQRRIYQTYAGYLYAVCSRYLSQEDDVKDVMQEGFIKILTGLAAYEYRGRGSLKSWMTRIMINEALKHLHNAAATEEDIERVEDMEDEPEPDIGGISPDDVHDMIRRLPEGYRTVLNLYIFEGHSHKEIADMLGISESTSASQYHRAKRMLKKLITEHNKD